MSFVGVDLSSHILTLITLTSPIVRKYSVILGERSSRAHTRMPYLQMPALKCSRSNTQLVATIPVHGGPLMPSTRPTPAKKARAKQLTFSGYVLLRVPTQSDAHSPLTYRQVNRNKKSIGLSFQHDQGVDILHRLAEKCDVLVENYLPGTLKKYGLDYETLSKINPSLIYVSITGYGQDGPFSSRAGYDVMVEAEFGLMHITGARDGPPVKVGVAVTDLTTGLYASNSIMAALIGRGINGQGQHIDVSLSDCQTATLANIASSCLISGKPDSGRWGTSHRE